MNRYPLNDASPYFISIVEFTNDNRMDLFITKRGSNSIGLLSYNGNEIYSESILFSRGSTFSISSAEGDLNSITILSTRLNSFQSRRDYNTVNMPSYYLRKTRSSNDVEYDSISNERIRRASDDLCPKTSSDKFNYGPSAVAIGDLNNDHTLDVIYGSEWCSCIGFRKWNCSSFAKKALINKWYISMCTLVVCDINNDN